MRLFPKGLSESLDIWEAGLKCTFKWKPGVLKAFYPFEAFILKITFQRDIAMLVEFKRGEGS